MRLPSPFVAVLVLVLAAGACSRTKDPSSSSSCGSLGDSCSPEGASCSPAPIGSGWSHAMTCSGGKWTELEIAPLPAPTSS